MGFSGTEKLRQNNVYFKTHRAGQALFVHRVKALKITKTIPDTARDALDSCGNGTPPELYAQIPYADYLSGCAKMISSFASANNSPEISNLSPLGAECLDIPDTPNGRLQTLPAPNS